MDKNQLGELMKQELRKRGVSAREAGREMGVAHTTIMRIIDGKPASLETLIKVAEWLKVDKADLIGAELETEEGLAATIAVLIDAEPGLGVVFRDAAEAVSRGEISADVVREIARYATWRIQDEQRKHQAGSQ